MMKRIVPFGTTLALALSLFIGCSDTSPVDSGAPTDDEYQVYKINEEDLSDFRELPTFDEAMAGTFGKPGPREFGKLVLASYVHKIRQLDLTDDQKAQIKLCFADYRSCVKDAAEIYRGARKNAHDSLKQDLSDLRAQVESGIITKEEARGQFEDLVGEYRAEVKSYADAYRESAKGCRDAFEECVKSVLTPDQLATWNSIPE